MNRLGIQLAKINPIVLELLKSAEIIVSCVLDLVCLYCMAVNDSGWSD